MEVSERLTGNIFESIPADLDDEWVELLAKNKNTEIERIISRGHTSPATGWYDQEKNEWVIVLKGEAIVCFENGKEINLKTGDYLTIFAHTKHKVKWTDPKTETVWLAVHY